MPLTTISAGVVVGGIDTQNISANVRKVRIEDDFGVGDLFPKDSYLAPKAFDSVLAEDDNKSRDEVYFPAICLSAIDGTLDISETNWPFLVPHLRSKKLTYREGKVAEKSSFDVTSWSITSNVATLTFADTAPENAILVASLEDKVVQGSFLRTIELQSAIGDISAGVYTISDIDTVARTVSFSYTSADNSGTGTYLAEFPTHKIAGSSTTARVFEVSGRSIVSANDGDDEVVSGLRRRDQMQQITGDFSARLLGATNNNDGGSGAITTVTAGFNASANTDAGKGINSLSFDSANSPNARTGTTTDPRSIGAHLYIWGGRYEE